MLADARVRRANGDNRSYKLSDKNLLSLLVTPRVPDSARWIVSGGLTIEPASWLVANVSGKYTSQRQSTFVNTPGSQVPGFTVFPAYVDIGDGVMSEPVKNIPARLNVDSLFDKDALSFISPAVTGDGFFRPRNPRTIQVTPSVGL